MATTAKLSNILLATVLGASASVASAQHTDVPTPPSSTATANANAQANAAAYEKIFNQTGTGGGQGGSASVENVSSSVNMNSQTTSINMGPPPKMRKERYNLGACSGNAYQALWSAVKLSSLYTDRAVGNLKDVTENSFTLRQYSTELDTDRKWKVDAIDDKINPKPIVPTITIADAYNTSNQTSTITGGQGGNATAASTGNSITYKLPITYTDVTYHCTLGK